MNRRIVSSFQRDEHPLGEHCYFCWVAKKESKVKKLSEMVLDFANSYIAMADNIEQKQQYLNSAVSAWNIACLDEKGRKRSIRKYMAEYRKLNPRQSELDFRHVKEDLRLLIKQKQKLYPEVRVQIVGAQIREIDGKNHVTVASVREG